MRRTFLCLFAAVVFGLGGAHSVHAQGGTSLSQLPLLHLADFQYEGAFRLPADTFGTSSLNYAQGPIEYNSGNHSLFIVGHSHHQAIAEFAVPALVKSTNLGDLNMAGNPRQVFANVIDRVPGGNPQEINRIGGMEFVVGPNGPELLVNAYKYYDAAAGNTHTTFVVRNANDIANSQIDGFYKLPGVAHASGWISPVPAEWQAALGGTYITGHSSGVPIISRLSVGPSAFAFDPMVVVGTNSVPDPIPTTKLLDFSLANRLHDDLYNSSLTNDIWTHLSRAVYGFIVPGTRTYVTLGYSGGHHNGVCYKCTQSDGNLCGGYCASDADDYSQYYWFWDVLDLIEVKEGRKNSYDVRPYEYGEWSTPFDTDSLGGGSFHPSTGLLYLTVKAADNLQGRYANPPVVVVYKFNSGGGVDTTAPAAPANLRVTY